MLRKFFSFVLFVLCLSGSVQAQVTVDLKIDSLQLLVGEQTGITLDVSLGANQQLTLPAISKGSELVPNVEVVEVSSPDTTYLDDGKRMDVQQKYIVTAWDSSYYYLPPLEVEVDGQKYPSKSLALKVMTLDVDTLHVDQFFPPNGVMVPPFSWDDWKNVVYLSFVVVLLALASFILFDRLRKGKPIVRIIRRKKKLPPHEVAIVEIEKIKADRKWAEEDSKEYYTLLTDTLRTYIRERYDFNAMEMTSSEIIDHLMTENDEEALNELRDIFRTADLVKFAKWSTLINENDANLMAAVEYINQTKIEVDPNAKPEPEIIKETDKQRLNQVWAMRILIGVFVATALAATVWVVWRIVDLMM